MFKNRTLKTVPCKQTRTQDKRSRQSGHESSTLLLTRDLFITYVHERRASFPTDLVSACR